MIEPVSDEIELILEEINALPWQERMRLNAEAQQKECSCWFGGGGQNHILKCDKHKFMDPDWFAEMWGF